MIARVSGRVLAAEDQSLCTRIEMQHNLCQAFVNILGGAGPCIDPESL
jgi:hypothetical protein